MGLSRRHRTTSAHSSAGASPSTPDRTDGSPTLASQVARLAGIIRALCPYDGRFASGIPDVTAVRTSRPSAKPVYAARRPVLCLIAQGAKQFLLGNELYRYNPSSMLVISVDLPAAAQVTQASPAEPYLGLIVGLDPGRIADLTLKAYPQGLPRGGQADRAMFVAPLDPAIVDAAIRLITLGTNPQDVDLLAPLVRDEILVRLLRGSLGLRVAQVGQADSTTAKVAAAIAWLRVHFAQPVRVEELAERAHMSPSAFHPAFKAVTALTPLQYQKTLRLQEARHLMLSARLDAASAGRQVGYLSASQFGREYARFFGQTPIRDVARLLEQDTLEAHLSR